jgi:HlyD family secretion protein
MEYLLFQIQAQEINMNKKQRIWIIGGISVVVIIALVLVITSLRKQTSSAAAYQTTTVQRGTLTSLVEGTGTVRAELSVDLTWQTRGQVSEVMAKIGDQVKAGDILAVVLQDSLILESNLVTAQENLAQLTSPEAIANAKLAVTSAQADVINAQIALNNLVYWKNDALIQDQYANLIMAKDRLDQAREAYDLANVGEYLNNVFEAQLYQALYNAQQSYDLAQYYYSVYSQKPTERNHDEAQATLDLAEATLTEAETYLTALTSGDIPTDATGTMLLKLKQARLDVQIAQENLDATRLTTPFSGTITQDNVILNAVVSAGTKAFRIDDLSNLVIDVQVVEIDVNQVKDGQTAEITFDAIPDKIYTGKVIKTDLSGTETQTSVTFTVTVQLFDADALVKPGMAANVTIVTNEVQDALLVPSTAVFVDDNNQRFVYLVQNGLLIEVPVTVGAISDTTTQVTGDTLQEGDTIVLSFATTSSQSSGFGFGMGGPPGGDDQTVVTNP